METEGGGELIRHMAEPNKLEQVHDLLVLPDLVVKLRVADLDAVRLLPDLHVLQLLLRPHPLLLVRG